MLKWVSPEQYQKPLHKDLWSQYIITIWDNWAHAREQSFWLLKSIPALQFGEEFWLFFSRFPDFLSLISYRVVAYIVRHANNDGRPINYTSRLKRLRIFTHDNHSLAVVLQNLTTTLSQLTGASQAWTAVLAEWKEEQPLEEDVVEPNPDRTAESMVRTPS